ncbi:hypothetical protein F5B22DRAFT_254985 [Xylaria bambusicola]|uniref:uncharacterized protein n=1 Tax=Xylaria bambusicola TaxID=326684 RepID=UPI002008DCB9|nr:uncharacterized protein F5B22DRAFT_254985 [Xylaria bambusicola]KAI0525815.1 hypothetical protein F5B22DRAFT_254985 [Xylaria bambusicola]
MSLALVHPRSLVSLEPTEYYGLYVGLGFILLLAYPAFSLIRILCGRANDHLWFFRQLLLPVWLCGRRIILGYEAIMFCLFLAVNILSIVIGSANDTTELIRRLGQVAIINLVPTFLGAHMNHVANACGFHYERYARLHTWLAAVVIVEVVLHTVLAVKQTGYDGPSHHVTGILASSSIGAIAVFSVPVIRRRMFELFTYIHTLLVTAALVAIWLHLPPSSFQRGPRLYLLLSSFIFASTKVGRLLNVLYLSISFSAGGSVATVQEQGGGVEVRVRLARPLRFKAGQYIYLSLWRLSTLSIFESHPFQICWAYRDESDQQVIVLLAQPRRGFTSRLLGPAPRKYRALIEGPYGKSLSLGEYGTVLLLATGVGIAGQLPYVKELLELYQDCQAKTRRVALFWELDAEVHRYWVKDWMDELLALDKDYILDMQLYIPGRFLSRRASESTVKKLGTHGRITLTYAAMRADQLIASEIAQRKGRTLVSLCTHATTTRAVVEVVQSFGDQNIRTEILDFQP